MSVYKSLEIILLSILGLQCHLLWAQTTENNSPSDSAANAYPERKDGNEIVTVVGSRIPGPLQATTQPIEIIDRQAIDRSGATTIQDLIRQLVGAANFGGYRPQIRLNETEAAGISGINLRGLGPKNTLVLLNGKRIPHNGVISSVDVNVLPLASVKRIEILKSGGSAIYGSDAVGGVVNIVFDEKIKNSRFGVRLEKPAKAGGGGSTAAYSSFGSNGIDFASATYLSYHHTDSLEESDRQWAGDIKSSFSFPPNYREYGKSKAKWHDYSTDENNKLCDGVDEKGRCLFLTSKMTQYYPELTQMSALHFGEYAVRKGLKLNYRLLFAQNEDLHSRAPNAVTYILPATVADASNIGSDVRSPGSDLEVNLRTLALGKRKYSTTEKTYDGIASVNAETDRGLKWSLSQSAGGSSSKTNMRQGFALNSEVTKLVSEGRYDPTSVESASIISEASYKPWGIVDTKQYITESQVQPVSIIGESYSVSSLVGAAYTSEIYTSQSDDERQNIDPKTGESNVLGSKSSSGHGDRRIRSLFTELTFNWENYGELLTAVRHDSYEDFGDTTNPSIAFSITPEHWIKFRASASRGYKAPPLRKLYESKSVDMPVLVDYKRCASTNDKSACSPTQYRATTLSNPNLKEETSENSSAGLAFFPNNSTSLEYTLWDARINGIIPDSIDWNEILASEAKGYDLNKLGTSVRRIEGSETSEIQTIESRLTNLSKRHVRGFDLSASSTYDISNQRLSLTANYSEVLYFKEQFAAGAAEIDKAGTYDYPRWRSAATLSYGIGKSDLSITNSRTAKHHKLFKKNESVSEYSQWDIHYSTGFLEKNLVARVGVIDLFRAQLPLDDSQKGPDKLSNRLYSAIGQTYYLGVDYQI